MQNIILYASQQSQMTDIILWVVLVLAIFALGLLVYWQLRIGKNLKYEIKQLNKINKNNVEYEFVLKTMRLSTWHIDPETMEIVFDNDFRDKHDTYAPAGGETTSNLGAAMSDQDRQKMFKAIKDLYDGVIDEAHLEYQILLPHSPKKYYWSESYAAVAERDIDGKPKRIVGTSMRIDERKALEEALVEARNRAEESDRLKTAFLANMSHEIRTPINVMLGMSELINRSQDTEEIHEYTSVIRSSGDHLLSIINNILDVTQIESGKTIISSKPYRTDSLLSELITMGAELSARKGLSFETDISPDMMSMLEGDKNHLRQLVTNFISKSVVTRPKSAAHSSKCCIPTSFRRSDCK